MQEPQYQAVAAYILDEVFAPAIIDEPEAEAAAG